MIQFKDLVVGQLLEVVRSGNEPGGPDAAILEELGAVYEIVTVEPTGSVNRDVTFRHHDGPNPLRDSTNFDKRTTFWFSPDDYWFPFFSVISLLTMDVAYTVPTDCFHGAMYFEAGEEYAFHHLEGNDSPWQLRPAPQGQGRERNGFAFSSEQLPGFTRVFGRDAAGADHDPHGPGLVRGTPGDERGE